MYTNLKLQVFDILKNVKDIAIGRHYRYVDFTKQ